MMNFSVLILAALSLGQGRGDGPTFVLPGAVSKAPDWLQGSTPFDLTDFFKAPPASENAAPLYLDALCEFSLETLNWHCAKKLGRGGQLTARNLSSESCGYPIPSGRAGPAAGSESCVVGGRLPLRSVDSEIKRRAIEPRNQCSW
jgi:hypothetical protein